MLKFSATDAGDLQIVMSDQSPSIYLDHWALRDISADSSLALRFVEVLRKTSGTLYVSALNMMEFAKVRREDSVDQAEALLEECLPQVFFVEFNPWVVVENEDRLIRTRRGSVPHGDFDLVRLLPSLKSKGLSPIGARGTFSSIFDSQAMRDVLERLGDTFKEQVERVRAEARQNPDLRRSLRSVPPGTELERATRYLTPQVLRFCVLDSRLRLSSNDAMDFFHSVVPIAYGDFVLLDGRWAAQAQEGIRRLRDEGHQAEMAVVLSGGKPGIERLLELLEERAAERPTLGLKRTPDGAA